MPNRLNSPALSAETAALDEFNKRLNEPDDTLTSLSDKDYKAWLRVMFAGLASLVQERYAALTASRKARFDQWCTEWEPQVDMVSPVQYVDRNKTFLRTKSNFAYLAEVLQSSKDWYLVSTSLVTLRDRKIEINWLIRNPQPTPQDILYYSIKENRSKRTDRKRQLETERQRAARQMRQEQASCHRPQVFSVNESTVRANKSTRPTARMRTSASHTPKGRQPTSRTHTEKKRPGPLPPVEPLQPRPSGPPASMSRFQPDPSIQAAERADLQRLDEQLEIPEDDLKGMGLSAYKAWLETVIAGIAALLHQCNRVVAASQGTAHTSRTANLFDRREEKIKKWCEDSEALVKFRTFSRSKDSARLRTKSSFTYLARLLKDGIWYQVSLPGKGNQQKHFDRLGNALAESGGDPQQRYWAR